MPSRFQTEKAVTCMKILLMIFNLVVWMVGCAVLATGIWIKMEAHKYLDIDPSHPLTSQIVIIFVASGITIALVGMFACCCTLSGNTILLYLYSAFLCVTLVLELTIGIASFAYRGTLKDSFKKGLNNSMRTYNISTESKEAVDSLQMTLQCCGVENYKDWQTVFQLPVPKSCCKLNNCITSNPMNINQDGCYSTVVDWINRSSKLIGIIGLAVGFFHILGILLTCCLARHINKAKYEPMG